MAVHMGKKIREEVDKQGMKIVAFAAKINRSRNVAYDIFERPNVDAYLLKQISKVLKRNFFTYLSTQFDYPLPDGITDISNDPEEKYFTKEYFLILMKDNQRLRKEIAQLKKTIAKQAQAPRQRKAKE